jgi:hypothetical protein
VRGSSAISDCEISWFTSAVSVCSSAAAVPTVTSCVTDAGARAMSTLASRFISTVMFFSVKAEKLPAALMLAVYCPGSRLTKRYSPALLACAVRTSPVSWLVNSTDALGTTAPVLSWTVPVRFPYSTCADSVEAETRAAQSINSQLKALPRAALFGL